MRTKKLEALATEFVEASRALINAIKLHHVGKYVKYDREENNYTEARRNLEREIIRLKAEEMEKTQTGLFPHEEDFLSKYD